MTTSFCLQKSEQVDNFAAKIGDLVEKHGLVTVDYKVGRTRSSFQQAALEVWCRNIASLFNESGVTREIRSPIFKKGGMEVDWTRDAVKNEIWRPVQLALTGQKSTTQPTAVDYKQISETIFRAFADKGMQLPAWPVRNDGGN